MAGNAVALGHRWVLDLVREDLRFMTIEAERTDRIPFVLQLVALARFMGIVTVGTAVLHRGMNDLLGEFLFPGLMADRAKR